MRRLSYKPYVTLFFLMFFTLSLKPSLSNQLRSWTSSVISPFWQGMNTIKKTGLKVLRWTAPSATTSPAILREVAILKRDNYKLNEQLELLKTHLKIEGLILSQIETLKNIPSQSEFFARRQRDLMHLIENQTRFISAKVFFREPSHWGSCLWINVGEKHNRSLGQKIIAKNSPVVVGITVVGIVEYVGEKRSRVRLITDASLVPSVRVLRGEETNRMLLEKIEGCLSLLKTKETVEGISELGEGLVKLKSHLSSESSNLYLAKGQLHGTSQPLWRSRGIYLKGIGFNYDFSDEEGPARHIQTGEPLGGLKPGASLALIQPGDLLVTTGLDGVFPKGLHVACVTSVEPLVEGAVSYNITAKSLIDNLDNLSSVTVLPALEVEDTL